MQINATEISSLQSATQRQIQPFFQLPQFHRDVSREVVFVDQLEEAKKLGRLLARAGIIQASEIPDGPKTPSQVIQFALGQWFKDRMEGLHILDFNVYVFNQAAAEKEWGLEDTQFVQSLDSTFALVLKGSIHASMRECAAIAAKLEAAEPGLFASAYEAIVEGGYRSIPLNTCPDLLDPMHLWECDYSEIPSDEEAMSYLIDMHGDDESNKKLLPSVLLPMFGGHLCLPITGKSKGKKHCPLTDKQLLTVAKSDDPMVAKIAQLTHKLRLSSKAAEVAQACFPRLDGTDLEQTAVGCNLLYEVNDTVISYVDDKLTYAMEAGQETELLGFSALPTSAKALATYFQKLDLSLAVMRDMDALIEMISTEHIPEDEK